MSKVLKWFLSFILIAGIFPILGVPAVVASFPISIVNPGFEDGLTGWQQLWPGNPAMVTSSPVHSGVNSLMLEDTKIDGYYGVNSLPIPAVVGESYKVTVSAYYETNAYGVLILAFDNQLGQTIKDTRVAVSGGAGKWNEMTVSLQAPANTASIRVRLISGLTQTGKVYFDDARLEKLTLLKGTVTQQDVGSPVPSVKLNLYNALDTTFTNPIASTTSGEDGSYTLPDVEPGAYVIRAKRNGFITQFVNVQYADGSNTSFDIQMVQDPASLPHPISGTVTELAHGQSLQGAKVSLFKETDHAASMEVTSSVTTNEHGSYSFPAVALSDRYFVKVEKSGYVTTREPVYVYDGPVLDADVQVPIEPLIYTAATIPKPSDGHPRLFVRSGDIPGIRAKQSMPFFQPLFANLDDQRNTQGYTSRSDLTSTANEMQTFTLSSIEEARYVRLVSRGSTGSNTLAIREIEVFKNGSGGGREEVPVQGATSIATCSNSSEFAADMAIDKDVNTLYCNFDLMGTITLDMGSNTFIQSLDIIFNYDTSRVYLFDILVSEDNTNWKLVDLGLGGGALPPAPAGQSNIIVSLLSQVNANAFAYMLDAEHNLAQGQKAVEMAMNIVDSAQYTANAYNNYTGQLLEMVALVYDWCYPLLTNEQKLHFKDAILRFAADMEMHYYDSGAKVFDFALGTGHGAEDQLFRHLLSAAIAVYDEYPNIYNRVVPEFLNKAVPVRDYFYGSDSHHQGGSYGATRYSTELWATAIFTKMGLPSPFSIKQSKVIYKQIYTRRPDGQLLRDGDEFNSVYTPLNTVWHYQPMAMLAAALFDDPYIKNEFIETYTPNELPIYEILLLDENTATQAKPLNDLPLSHYFNDPEASMVARTGWDDVSTTTHQSSSVIAEMKIGNRRFGNHEHMDFGSFQIYYKGGLAIDSGIFSGMTNGEASNYFSPHDQYYNKRTIASNSMLVYDPNEGTIGNDGGQRWRDTGTTHNGIDAQTLQDVFGSNYKFGEVQGHEFGPDPITPDYSYIKGDLSSAYTAKVEQYQRSMLFLNMKSSTNPAAMIVFDRVVSSDPNFKKYWLLHSLEEPVVDEASKTSTIMRTDKGDSGKLVNQTLLPEASNAVIEKIGGPGHEFDVFGTNYPITPTNPNNTEEQGAWRIQVSPGTPEKEDLFLNVIQVMDGDKQPLPVQKLDAPALVGVQLADKAVLFSKSGKRLSGTVTFSVYSGSNESQFMVTDLEPGFWRIEHDGVVQFGKVTKEGNVLSFNGAAGTTYTLTSVPSITAPADATLSPDITVPTNTDVIVTISYPTDSAKKEYKLGESGTWVEYTAPIVVSNNNTVFARSKNAVGNMSNVTNYVVSNIDKTVPSATVVYSPLNDQSVVATITPSEPITITNNGGSSSYNFLFNGSFTFEFVDEAGNQGTITATVNNIVLKSKAKPGASTLSDDNGYDTGIQDGNYKVTMNLWYGENGKLYQLYENDLLIDTKILTDNSPSAQSTVTSITNKQNGTYRYYAVLTNAFGATMSSTHVVAVTNAAPGKAVLSGDNWDGDGNFKVNMNMWWGTNGTTYNLYENGVLIYTQALANQSPTAQTAVTTFANKAKGIYEYRAELINYAGATSTEKMIINVTK